ncbi:hypothetical protein MWH03_00080 [Klebsiella pneumoniae]|nr:hypothetical protein [Klebsiella pneumoniae]
MSTLKSFVLTATSVFLVLIGAYYMGGRAAKKAAELKRQEEAARRANATIEVQKDVEQTIRSHTDDAVIDELHSDWMRR